MDLKKSVLFPLKDCNLTHVNFDPIINTTQNRFNSWLSRDLSLQGRVLLSKAEGISICVGLTITGDAYSNI